jgi:hypothetical protein
LFGPAFARKLSWMSGAERWWVSTSMAVVIAVILAGCGGNSVGGNDSFGRAGKSDHGQDPSGAAGLAGNASSSGGHGGNATGAVGAVGLAPGGGASTGGAAPNGGGAAASAPSGGSAGSGTGGGAGAGECNVVYPNLELTDCEALERFVEVHDARIDDSGGDGQVSPGESIRISVTLSETTGAAVVAYPGIDFRTSDTGILLDRTGPDVSVYAIGPCESIDDSVGATLSDALLPGSVIHVTARAASLNRDCPYAAALVIPIVVGDR